MITGVVTADRQAIINLTVRGPTGQEHEIEAIVDTGFDGWLTYRSTGPDLAPTWPCALGGREGERF